MAAQTAGQRRDDSSAPALNIGLELLSDKWRILILQGVLCREIRKYSELERSLGATTNMLADRLKSMVDSGLLEKRAYRDGQARTRYEYHATDIGRGAALVIAAMHQWVTDFSTNEDSPMWVKAGSRLPLRVAFVDPEGNVVSADDAQVTK